MRAVILGTDLMYDKSGRLVPIEINTNIGYDSYNRVEKDEEWLDLTSLVKFIRAKKIKKVILDCTKATLNTRFAYFSEKLTASLPKTVKVEKVQEYPEEVADNELFIRIAYNEEALVDSYCRDKVGFLNITFNSSKIAQEYLYKEDGEVKGHMSDFVDNGPYRPNYIVKFRYPQYNVEYPKYYKLNSLDAVYALAKSLEDGYLIMPCYLNENRMYEGNRYILFRQWSLLVPDETEVLKAIDLGSYTKVSGKPVPNVFDEETGELLGGRDTYVSKFWVRPVKDVLLEDGDQVLMSDGTWKDIKDVEKGDKVLSVDVPHTEDVDLRKHTGALNITVKELEEDSKYSVNEVLYKGKVDGFQSIIHMIFEEDNEEWWDTANSSYLTLGRQGETVEFRKLINLKEGDKIYLIKLTGIGENSKVEYVERTIKEIWTERKLEEGYTLSLDGSHLFITKSPESTAGYVSIEHNADDPEGECQNHCNDRWGDSLVGIACDHATAEEIVEGCTPHCKKDTRYPIKDCDCYCIYRA